MNLSDYISLTLREIAEGVQKANKYHKKTGEMFVLSEIKAPIEGVPVVRICGQQGGDIRKPIIKVAFRVGVEVEEIEESNRQIKGSLKVISANGESATKDGRKSTHEVSFELPLILPK